MKSHNVPEGWETKQITEISEIISGSTPSTSINKYWDGSIVWITPEDLSKNDSIYLDSSARNISESGLRNCSAKLIPSNSIVMSSRAPIGYLAVMKVAYATNQGCKNFRVKKDNPEYVYYSLSYNMPKIKQMGEGTTFSEISKSQLERIKITLPRSKNEQITVASILLTLDKAIGKTKTLIEKNKRIKQGLMKDLFSYGVDENGKTHDVINSFEIGIKPKEWDVTTIRKICKLRRGASPRPIDDPIYFSDKGRGWVRISDVTASYKYLRQTDQYMSKYGETLSVRVNPGDLIMSICATIGRPIILEMEACIHDGFVFFDELSKEYDKEFMFYFLQYKEIEINRRRQIGTQGNLNTGIVNSLLVPKPKYSEQKRISERLNSIDIIIGSEEFYLAKLNMLKAGLLHDLLTGKVRVKVAA